MKEIGCHTILEIAWHTMMETQWHMILEIRHMHNNAQERLLRSHVVGRKTWYGVHSERGAFTAAVLFSIIETRKLNKINPKEYLKSITEDLLHGRIPPTPSKFKSLVQS